MVSQQHRLRYLKFSINAQYSFTLRKSLLQGHQNDKKMALEASFSPDSQFVFSGSSDGKMHVWHAESGQKVGWLKQNEISFKPD